jgi:asparagine synthase (glutamine-hydrolysing)
MISADRRRVIVYNGEIYNFAEVRSKLSALGHRFTGSGDTEVLMHAFGEWGADAIHQFIGMFAFALWNEEKGTLELYRDRVGVKPLYFGWHDGVLCFASELKALRAFRHWQPELNRLLSASFCSTATYRETEASTAAFANSCQAIEWFCAAVMRLSSSPTGPYSRRSSLR